MPCDDPEWRSRGPRGRGVCGHTADLLAVHQKPVHCKAATINQKKTTGCTAVSLTHSITVTSELTVVRVY